MLHHPAMIGGWVGRDLGRLTRAVIRDRGVDLRSGRASGRRSADSPLVARARGSGALRGLGRETAGRWSLSVLLLELRLLRRRRRRGRGTLKSRRRRRHVGRLLLLLLWVRRRRQSTLTNLPREYRAKSSIIPRVADLRRRLSGTDVLGRVHGARRASAAFQLPAQHGNLVLVPSDSTGQPVVFGYQRCATRQLTSASA